MPNYRPRSSRNHGRTAGAALVVIACAIVGGIVTFQWLQTTWEARRQLATNAPNGPAESKGDASSPSDTPQPLAAMTDGAESAQLRELLRDAMPPLEVDPDANKASQAEATDSKTVSTDSTSRSLPSLNNANGENASLKADGVATNVVAAKPTVEDPTNDAEEDDEPITRVMKLYRPAIDVYQTRMWRAADGAVFWGKLVRREGAVAVLEDNNGQQHIIALTRFAKDDMQRLLLIKSDDVE